MAYIEFTATLAALAAKEIILLASPKSVDGLKKRREKLNDFESCRAGSRSFTLSHAKSPDSKSFAMGRRLTGLCLLLGVCIWRDLVLHLPKSAGRVPLLRFRAIWCQQSMKEKAWP